MTKIFNYLVLILLTILIVINFIATKNNYKVTNKIELLESKVDSLSNKKDSIQIKILTVEKQINNNKLKHEKIINNIVHQSTSSDSIFANEYIKKFINERLCNY